MMVEMMMMLGMMDHARTDLFMLIDFGLAGHPPRPARCSAGRLAPTVVFGVWSAELNLSTFLSRWCDVASVRTDVDGNEAARASSRQVAPRSATGACGGRGGVGGGLSLIHI